MIASISTTESTTDLEEIEEFERRKKRAKKLYDVRSRVSHGQQVSDDALASAVVEARAILRLIIMEWLKKDSEHSVVVSEATAITSLEEVPI
jgi:hypothetical protein